MWDNDGVFDLSAGQIVADKYRIDGVMGTGGMGVVVAATHIELAQRVAIKFLREVSAEALARFQREARLLVRLKSPHVARVIDVGALDDDTPYIVMEHLDGEDLSFAVANNKTLPIEETVDYILQASEALAEAHALGMVHRDLKPANLFLARGPGGTTSVKILDFGVSKILDDRSNGTNDPRGGDLTHEGVALGSPGYMAPEQMTSSRDVDERADIFSLGALLYRLVTGQTPYRGTSVVGILATMATEGLQPVRSLAPDVPESFAAIVEKCLAQDKEARFRTVAHLAHALAPYATRRGRVAIEQIIATLNIEVEEETLGETKIQPAMVPNPAAAANWRGHAVPHAAMPQGPMMGPPTPGPGMIPIGYHDPRQTGPQLAMPQASMPPTFVAAQPAKKPISQVVAVAFTIAALTIFAGAAIFRVLRAPQNVVEEPHRALIEPSSAGVPSAAISVPPVAPEPVAPPTISTSTILAPPDPATAAPSAAPSAEPKPKPAPPVRPRPHGASGHTSTSNPNGPSPPPNPADVPGGRR